MGEVTTGVGFVFYTIVSWDVAVSWDTAVSWDAAVSWDGVGTQFYKLFDFFARLCWPLLPKWVTEPSVGQGH